MWQTYYAAKDLQAALELLDRHGDQARVIAGGTDLLLEMEAGQRPDLQVLIDISRVYGQDHIKVDAQGWVHMGPLVTHNHCAGSPLLVERAFALARACWEVGAPQIRNRGTIAGNLITASPANDSITPLMALGARVTLRSRHGERSLPLEEFFTGVRKTVMQPGELLVDVAFPLPDENTRSTFIKFALRRAQAISLLNVAVVLKMDGERVERASITLGAVAPVIIHAREAEEWLVGKALTEEHIERAAELAAGAARPIDDLRASAAYRREMVRVCTARALRALAAGEERAGYPDRPVMLWGRDDWHVGRPLPDTLVHERGDPIETIINGRAMTLQSPDNKSLLHLLREEAGLTGTKEGCAEGECGACTVFLDGVAVMSCLVPAPRAMDAQVVTIEGIGGEDWLHPLQRAFIEEGAVQCGYCTPGFLMSGVKLLEENPSPSRQEIVHAITGNLCRCTGYYKIINAFEKAAQALAKEGAYPQAEEV